MNSWATEKKALSQERSIIQKFQLKDFINICDELNVVKESTQKLLDLANDNNTSKRDRINIYTWFIEMNIGKAKPMSDQPSDQNIKIVIHESVI